MNMKIERFDHLHVNPKNFDAFNENLVKFLGHDLLMNMPMEEYGTEVGYEPFPIGVESFRVSDSEKSVSARVAGESEGVFCICFKVDDIKDAINVMEEKGWKMIDWIDNTPILEALFDTKDDLGFYIEMIEYPFESMRQMMGAEID